jgi:hypothetical protein
MLEMDPWEEILLFSVILPMYYAMARHGKMR